MTWRKRGRGSGRTDGSGRRFGFIFSMRSYG